MYKILVQQHLNWSNNYPLQFRIVHLTLPVFYNTVSNGNVCQLCFPSLYASSLIPSYISLSLSLSLSLCCLKFYNKCGPQPWALSSCWFLFFQCASAFTRHSAEIEFSAQLNLFFWVHILKCYTFDSLEHFL